MLLHRVQLIEHNGTINSGRTHIVNRFVQLIFTTHSLLLDGFMGVKESNGVGFIMCCCCFNSMVIDWIFRIFKDVKS